MLKLTKDQYHALSAIQNQAENLFTDFENEKISDDLLKIALKGLAAETSIILPNYYDLPMMLELIDRSFEGASQGKTYRVSRHSSGSLLRYFEVPDEFEVFDIIDK